MLHTPPDHHRLGGIRMSHPNNSTVKSAGEMKEVLFPSYKHANLAESSDDEFGLKATKPLEENARESAEQHGIEIDLSLEKHLRELEERRRVLGDSDLSVADTLNVIGLHCHHVTNNQSQALSYHREALGVLLRAATAAGSDTATRNEIKVNIAVTITDIGNALKWQKRNREAMEAYNEALGMFRSLGMKEDHPRVSAVLRCVNRIDHRWKGETLAPQGASS